MGAIKKLFSTAYKDLRNKDFFSRTIIGTITLIALTLASAITTFNGMWEYTELWFVSLMTTIGVQLIMLHTAGKIIALEEIHSDRFWTLTLIYLMAMIVSSFFSFAAFYETIESDERLRSQSNLVLRTQWGNVYSEIIDTNKLDLLGSYYSSNGLAKWNDDYAGLKTNAERYWEDVKSIYETLHKDVDDSIELKNKDREEKVKILSRIDKRINELENEISTNSGDVARFSSMVESISSDFSREKDTGGTVREDGSITPAGYGTEAKKIERELKRAERQLDSYRADQAEFEAELNSLKNRRASILGEVEENEIGLEEKNAISIKNILSPHEKLKVGIQKLPQNNQISVNDFQSLNQALINHREKVELCSEIKVLVSALDSAIANTGDKGLPRADPYGILNNQCDVSPMTDGTTDFLGVPEQLKKFEQECAPEKIPEGKPSYEDIATQEQKFVVGGKQITAEQKNYLEDFNALKAHLIQCMKYPPRAKNNAQSAKILNDFTSLLLAYDPTAHPFTRAVEAFNRGELTAYIAAIIALIIDLLIYTFSLTLRGLPSVSNNEGNQKYEYYDHIVLLFEENPYLLGWLLDSPVYDEEKELHVIKTSSHAYSRYREQIIYLHTLNAINLDTIRGEITLSSTQYEYLVVIRNSEGLC